MYHLIVHYFMQQRLTGGWSDSHGRNRWMHVRGIWGRSLPAWEIYGARLPCWWTLGNPTVTTLLPYGDRTEIKWDGGHSDPNSKLAQSPYTPQETTFCCSIGRQVPGPFFFWAVARLQALIALESEKTWHNATMSSESRQETQSCTKQQQTSLTKVYDGKLY